MDNISEALRAAGIPHDVFDARQMVDLRFSRPLKSCNIVLLHTPLLLTLSYALMARHWHRRPIIALVWDSYPVTLGGVRYDRSLRRRILDRIENFVVSLCDHILVPSADFLEEPRFAHAHVVSLWHPVVRPTGETQSGDADDTATALQVLFAGQINATRGLVAAVARLDQATGGRFHLKVASSDPLPTELVGHPKVEYLGYLERRFLREVAATCDCGLVSLARDFGGPGLPSKSFEYLEAGIPCLYYGKRLRHYLRILQESGAGLDISERKHDTLKREDVLRLKQNIHAATAAFAAAFELDPPSLIARLFEVKA